MNIRKITYFLFTSFLLSACDFNEDFCIRDGILYATCDYSRIETGVKMDPTNQHLIGYGRSNQTRPVSPVADFVTDTLKWIAPQGNYDFILFSGTNGYSVRGTEDMYTCSVYADLQKVESKNYYAVSLPMISYNIFSEKLLYQEPVTKEVTMKPLTQEIIVRLHLQGNQLNVLDSLYSEIDGICVGRKFHTRETSKETATIKTTYQKFDSDKKLWEGSSNVLGISNNERINFRLYTRTSNNSDETYDYDLTPYLKGVDQYKIIINLDLIVGRELELKSPILVESWATGEQVEIEISPVLPN